VNVRFACPKCDCPARVDPSGPTDWHCPACDHQFRIEAPQPGLSACTICGNHELYKKKDFPHWLGMTILVVGCTAFVILNGMYEKWLAWAVLLGTALLDSVLFLWVGDAVVCYRCNAHYHGFASAESHKPFELTIGERYRQERIRQEQLAAAKSATDAVSKS
jgi:hypothetical protein